MNILVTGARGFVGRNLCAQLKNIRDGKARNYPVSVSQVFEYDIDSDPADLERYCREADFVFNLAGVNRPENPDDYRAGNFGFATTLLDTLRRHDNRCPVMLSSSIQATLIGRYGGHPYGESKRAGEELFFEYSRQTGARVLVYRFPNLFGKWCRPNYNSAVATFCHNIARGLPVTVSDPAVELELVYIDDLVDELIAALTGGEHRCDFDGLTAVAAAEGRYCHVPTTFRATLGQIVDMLRTFAALPDTRTVPAMAADSLAKRLFATYLSYLPADRAAFDLTMNSDARGSFTELIRTAGCGQVSVNISRPGVTKGEHWHNTKWEQFIVVRGRGLIRMRREGSDEVIEYRVDGDHIRSVLMLPGYTHNIINLSDTEDLVTVMYCNEPFDPSRPDTYHDPVTE